VARIFEYQGKQLLKRVGVKIPEGGVASNPDEARDITKKIGKGVAIKAQIWATGRFKAGGIKFASDPDEAFAVTKDILGSRIKGLVVKKVLVEERLDVLHEYYAGIVVNASMKIKAPVLVLSTEGGTKVEEVAARNPERVVKYIIDPIDGLAPADVDRILKEMGIEPEISIKINPMITALYTLFKEYDATNAEINPFVLTTEGHIYAADCHVSIDDNSVFRHPELGIKVPRDMEREPTQLEQLAWDHIEEGDYRGTGYFAQMITDFKEEENYVGFHGIGGGGSMLGAAALISRGIKIANYADTSGDPPASKIYKVIKAIFSQPLSAYAVVGACLANQEQWYHAFAIVKALREELADRSGFPVVILLAGNKEKEAIRIIEKGLKGLDLRMELYGRDHIYNSDFIGERVEILMKEYLNEEHLNKKATEIRMAMGGNKLEFATRSMKTTIDYDKCEPAKNNTSNPSCGFACVKADRLYDRGILRIEGNRPVLAVSEEAAHKMSNESLSWEYACNAVGMSAVAITIDFPGLEAYRKRLR
jgi:succinyl-CoA synthetase beta subunit